MLIGSRGRMGQGLVSEYAVMVVIGVAVISAMMVYVRRAYQGRVRDTSQFMMQSAASALGKNIRLEYEPYYTESSTIQTVGDNQQTDVLGAPGIFRKQLDFGRNSIANSVQYPPKNAI